MDEKEIFAEIMKSPTIKDLLGMSNDETVDTDYDSASSNKVVNILKNIIEGQVRHTSDDNILKNIIKVYEL